MRFSATVMCALCGCLCACSASFSAYDAKGTPLPGIPVAMSRLVTVRQITSYRPIPSAGANAVLCMPDTLTELTALPSETFYYVNVTGAAFSSPKLEVTYNDAGTPKSISMNAENKGPDFIKEAAGALGTVIPLIAPKTTEREVTRGAPAGDETLSAKERKEKYCLSSQVRKEIVSP